MPIIQGTQETVAHGLQIQGQLGQLSEILSQKKIKRVGSIAQ
jgi:hypothetical protein